jgi:hypothetical protein
VSHKPDLIAVYNLTAGITLIAWKLKEDGFGRDECFRMVLSQDRALGIAINLLQTLHIGVDKK